MDMDTDYNFKLSEPKEKLHVSIKQNDKNGIVLIATQTGEKRNLHLSN